MLPSGCWTTQQSSKIAKNTKRETKNQKFVNVIRLPIELLYNLKHSLTLGFNNFSFKQFAFRSIYVKTRKHTLRKETTTIFSSGRKIYVDFSQDSTLCRLLYTTIIDFARFYHRLLFPLGCQFSGELYLQSPIGNLIIIQVVI